MKKYNVSVNEIVYYLTTEIEAENEEQAIEKYLQLMDDGMIRVNESELQEPNAVEVK